MHRELTTTDEVFQPPKTTALYLLTGILLLLVGRDLWPELAGWLNGFGLDLPTWSREIYGIRYALIAAVIGGARVLYGSLDSLFAGRLGADMALAVACIAAIVIGEWLVAAEVVLIGLIGECLESFTFARTQNAIRKLAELFPIRCWLVRDGQEVRVLVKDVQVGDVVVVKPGARVPVDGVVRDGRSAVDVSALTGESLPVDKGPGDEVLAGSINQVGALTIITQRVQEQTVAGRVIAMTAKALKDKAPMERHADKLARWFLPIVLALAAITFFANVVWYAGPFRGEARLGFSAAARLSVYPTVAVLVVACPCALILATPAAVIAALGRLAGTGVLLKSGAALERLAGVTAFAFDKTGTLTEGRLELGDLLPLDLAVASDELLRIAATAEQRSEHPLARLIVQEARRRNLNLTDVDDFTALPGAGVSATIGGLQLLVGNRRLMQEKGVPQTAEVTALLDRLDADGQTALLIACNGHVLGAVGARDRVRPEAFGMLQELRESGISEIAMVTGDRVAVARRVATELGIEQVHAELLPAEKVAVLAARPHAAFVGDGINDAPALATAAVGIAVGGGAEIAAEAGDIVFLGDPLRPLPMLLRLSRQTVAIIRQNIFVFAFGVNLVGIVLTGWLWPLLARSPDWYEKAPLAGVIYHQLGSLLVLLNSMRLLAFERAATRKAASRVGPLLRQIDRWIDRLTNVDELLHDLSHRWKQLSLGGASLAMVIYLLSGFTQVGADEVAVVRRFGRPLDSDLGPGLHWCYPWPVDAVVRVQPERVRSVEVGFRVVRDRTTKPDPKGRPAFTWLSQHDNEGVLRIPEEASMPTGDGNLIELLATLHYRVSDPRRYLLEVGQPDEILRANFEAVLREAVAGESFLTLLTERRDGFQRQVFARLQERLNVYGTGGLGVTLEGMALRDLHPPEQVVSSFHAVAKAAEDHAKSIMDATSTAQTTVRSAEATANELERKAESEAHRVVQIALRDRDAFLAWHRARTKLSPQEESALASEALGRIFGGQDLASALAEHQRQRDDRLAINAYLIDFRLTWEVLAQTLSQRDKVFIDVDKLPGRRTLLLFGPEQLTPPPIIIPNRMPDRKERDEDR